MSFRLWRGLRTQPAGRGSQEKKSSADSAAAGESVVRELVRSRLSPGAGSSCAGALPYE